jgi:hypothetical protein
MRVLCIYVAVLIIRTAPRIYRPHPPPDLPRPGRHVCSHPHLQIGDRNTTYLRTVPFVYDAHWQSCRHDYLGRGGEWYGKVVGTVMLP